MQHQQRAEGALGEVVFPVLQEASGSAFVSFQPAVIARHVSDVVGATQDVREGMHAHQPAQIGFGGADARGLPVEHGDQAAVGVEHVRGLVIAVIEHRPGHQRLLVEQPAFMARIALGHFGGGEAQGIGVEADLGANGHRRPVGARQIVEAGGLPVERVDLRQRRHHVVDQRRPRCRVGGGERPLRVVILARRLALGVAHQIAGRAENAAVGVQTQRLRDFYAGLRQRPLHAELRRHVVAVEQAVGRLVAQHQRVLGAAAAVVIVGVEQQVAARRADLGALQRALDAHGAARQIPGDQRFDARCPGGVAGAAGDAGAGARHQLFVGMRFVGLFDDAHAASVALSAGRSAAACFNTRARNQRAGSSLASSTSRRA